MFMRIDRLQAALPEPKKPEPNAAAALLELLGGKYGEMSTLGNYMFQSFNFRNKTKLKPFYGLVNTIFQEELGHVELVSTGVAMLNNGPGDSTEHVDISKAPFEQMQDVRNAGGFFQTGGGAQPVNSNFQSWNNDMVTTTGNIIVDLLHISILSVARACISYASMRRWSSRPGARCAVTCSCADRSTPMLMRWR